MDCYRYQNMLCVRRGTSQTFFSDLLKQKGYWFSTENFSYSSPNDTIIIFFNTTKLKTELTPIVKESLDFGQEDVPIGHVILLEEKYSIKIEKMVFTDFTKFTECMQFFYQLILKTIYISFTAAQLNTINLEVYWNKEAAELCNPILKSIGLVDSSDTESYKKTFDKNILQNIQQPAQPQSQPLSQPLSTQQPFSQPFSSQQPVNYFNNVNTQPQQRSLSTSQQSLSTSQQPLSTSNFSFPQNNTTNTGLTNPFGQSTTFGFKSQNPYSTNTNPSFSQFNNSNYNFGGGTFQRK